VRKKRCIYSRDLPAAAFSPGQGSHNHHQEKDWQYSEAIVDLQDPFGNIREKQVKQKTKYQQDGQIKEEITHSFSNLHANFSIMLR
jgi:hypothetical protein